MSDLRGIFARARRAELRALHPDQLAALRAGVRHAKIADKGHEAALSVTGASGADRCRLGFDRRDKQRPSWRRTGDHRRPRLMARDARTSVPIGVPTKEPVI